MKAAGGLGLRSLTGGRKLVKGVILVEFLRVRRVKTVFPRFWVGHFVAVCQPVPVRWDFMVGKNALYLGYSITISQLIQKD